MLYWIPPVAALVLGALYLSDGGPSNWTKVSVAILLGAAQYLQFFAGGMQTWIAGVLINVFLGVSLSLWLKFRNAGW